MQWKELDNILIADIPILLNENTTLARYHSLIPNKDRLVTLLGACGIEDRYALAYALNDTNASDRFGDDTELLMLLSIMLGKFNYKAVSIKQIDGVPSQVKDTLLEHGIRTTFDIISLCMRDGMRMVTKTLHIDAVPLQKLLCLCDLFRLPGVLSARANLYFDCGYRTLSDFSVQTAEKMQSDIAAKIEAMNSDRCVPQKKELSTQIAVAKVLPQMRIPD